MDTIYTLFDKDNDITSATTRITYAMWSGGVGVLTAFYTSSGLTPIASSYSSKYYYNVYGSATTGSAQVEYSIAYGHRLGYGVPSTDRDKPTLSVYRQYANILLSNPRSNFTYLNSGVTTTLDDFVAISIKRVNLKQKLDAGNWQLNISGSNNNTLYLIDDSGDSSDTNYSNIGRVLNVVSGSITNGAYSTTVYGLCYPDHGVILLNPSVVSGSATFTYATGSSAYNNNHGSLQGAIARGGYFAARSEETIASNHYFVRVKNKEYNYSTNPTFVTGSDQTTVLYPEFYNDPKTFITTVGLYNDQNELLAVGKLSKPVKKSFSSECLIKTRIDF